LFVISPSNIIPLVLGSPPLGVAQNLNSSTITTHQFLIPIPFASPGVSEIMSNLLWRRCNVHRAVIWNHAAAAN
jgi:hypothetical protein